MTAAAVVTGATGRAVTALVRPPITPVRPALGPVPGPTRRIALDGDAVTAAAAIGRAATLALHDELALAPKPGLVSFVDSGSHDDMDARTFMRSLFALRRAFPVFASLGIAHAGFAPLQQAGIEAEARMLQATGGINTHRGAIFSLGLLCAAAGRLVAGGQRLHAGALSDTVLSAWGPALAARARRPRTGTHGGRLAAQHGLRGANAEAAAGFPTLFEVALPAWRAARRRGLDRTQARLETFFATLASLEDTNLVHRGGMEGLRFAQRSARAFLAAGGAGRPDAASHALAVHRRFVARRLSPGGAADVLAAVCWLDRIGVADGLHDADDVVGP